MASAVERLLEVHKANGGKVSPCGQRLAKTDEPFVVNATCNVTATGARQFTFSSPEDEQLVLHAVKLAALRATPGDLLSVGGVRALVHLDKDRFDGAALALQAAGKVILTHDDAWTWRTPEQQEAMVASGEYRFNGIALRRVT